MSHPGEELIEALHDCDFAVFGHGFAAHGRDYLVVVQNVMGNDPGTNEVTFTHCVYATCETRVRDDVWPLSWTDEFTDYGSWQQAGEPDGYVWGTNWSNAYPGITLVRDSVIADQWSDRLGQRFYELTLETDRFLLRLVFHSIRTRKVSDDLDTISRVHFPLDP